MKKSVNTQDVIWNYIGIIMSMASNFLLLPFMMYFLDADILGLWYIFLSIGGIVNLFDFGFNPTLARNVAYCWGGAKVLTAEGVQYAHGMEPNFILLGKVIKTCKRIYLLIASVALFLLVTIGTVYIKSVSVEVFGIEVFVSWCIYSFAVFLNLYYGYYSTFLRGVGAVAQYNKINVFARIVQIMTSIIMMWFGWGLIAVSLAYMLYGFLLRILSKRTFYNYENIGGKLNELKIVTTCKEFQSLFIVVWHNAWRDGIVAIANYCSSQASTLIASAFLTLTETGIYSIGVQLVTAIATIGAGLYTAYQPSMQRAYLNADKKELKRLMATAMVVYDFVFLVGVIGLLTIGISILQIIQPESIFSRGVILGIGVYNFFYKRQSYYASYISNTNHVPYMVSYLLSGFAGVIFAYVLISFFNLGVWGLIIGQFVPQLMYNCWKWPKEVMSMLKTNIREMGSIGVGEIFKIMKKTMKRGNI